MTLEEDEYVAFLMLSSAYRAVHCISTNAATVRTEIHMRRYYDEDENNEQQEIRRRIAKDPKGITLHFNHCVQASKLFYSVTEAINTNRRQGIITATEELCDVIDQLITVVEKNQQDLADDAFFDYPYCPQGHILYHAGRIGTCSFNQKRTKEGAMNACIRLRENITVLANYNSPIKDVILWDGRDDGETLIDGTLRAGLTITRKLLGELDFKLPEV